ncbi:MAG TPA: hypothetical protein VFD20_05915 [Demequina sp.]|nr:hypothetical protein [Demequina sp.]
MKGNSVLGIIGGILIALSVFLTGNTFTFSGAAIKETVPLILFIAALAVIAFSVMKNRTATGYAAMVAVTIALIQLVDMLRNGSFELSVRLALLVVGVILALISSLGHRKG